MVIKHSSIMNGKSVFENKLIRASKKIREEFNLILGELVVLDKSTVLQVEEIFRQDLNIYGDQYAFVTNSTLNRLGNDNHTLEYSKSITLGCDPELFLVDKNTGVIVNPRRFFKKWDAIGTDGLLCELRPLPSINADQTANKLGNMLKSVRNTLDKFDMNQVKILCKSHYGGLSAGFHCHIGLSKSILDTGILPNKTILETVIRALDYYVGVAAVIPEGTNDSQRRCAPFIQYGKVSDHRVKTCTLEYRVPGGALLKSPILTKGLLELCSLVARDAITRLKIYTNGFKKTDLPETNTIIKHIYPNIPNTTTLYSLMCVPSVNKAKEHFNNIIIKDLQKMFNYKKHSNNIEKFISSLDEDIENDVILNWEHYNE